MHIIADLQFLVNSVPGEDRVKTEQILDMARRHFEDNMPQEAIARDLSVSTSTVSRALKLARERGWVRTVVVGPSEGAFQLESWLRKRFRLAYVAVVPAPAGGQDALEAVAQAGAAYVERVAPARGAVTVAGGRTLTALARQLRPAHRPGLAVLPAMGGWVGQSAIGANEVARAIALRWDAQAGALFAPSFVSDDHVRQTLLAEESIRDTLEKARNASLACIGIAAVTPELSMEQARYASSAGIVSVEDTRYLLGLGAVGETCAQFFDIEGNLLDSWNRERTVALLLNDFRNIPAVLAVGTGVEKARAFLGACRAGLMTALVIDEHLALEMKHLDREDDNLC